jgi:hypothetical protein
MELAVVDTAPRRAWGRMLSGKEGPMPAIRSARAVWQGDLFSGAGEATAETSHAFGQPPIGWKARTETEQSQTNSEELIAAAFQCAVSAAKNGRPVSRA